MCGIIGYVGKRDAETVILDGLARLEYRGYDSAGLTLADPATGALKTVRAVGPLAELRAATTRAAADGSLPRDARRGLGHTRWATHGRPAQENAHPFTSNDGRVVCVLNGIIENHAALRAALEAAGAEFHSQTDAEVVPHMLAQILETDPALTLAGALVVARQRFEGRFAIVAMHQDEPGTLVATCHRTPLVVGVGEGEAFIASAIDALLPWTRRVQRVGDDELVVVTAETITHSTLDGVRVRPHVEEVDWDAEAADRRGYASFMRKEIDEQPSALRRTLAAHLNGDRVELGADGLDAERWRGIDRVVLVGCGTSYHAGVAGRRMLETWAGLRAEVDTASEWRYRDAPVGPDTLVIGITQSGETADTLAAMERAKEQGATLLALTNAPGSQATRLADHTLLTHAGLEVGVAATKTHTTQLAALALLAIAAAQARRPADSEQLTTLVRTLTRLPDALEAMLGDAAWLAVVEEIARGAAREQFSMFLGRGAALPVALEAALKLKEIAYVPTDAYAAGEMKHGPIALITDGSPVVLIGTGDALDEKLASNLAEVAARGAYTIVITGVPDGALAGGAEHVIGTPRVPAELVPLVAIIPLQLYALEIARTHGLDVDRPRNLAKTVTVE